MRVTASADLVSEVELLVAAESFVPAPVFQDQSDAEKYPTYLHVYGNTGGISAAPLVASSPGLDLVDPPIEGDDVQLALGALADEASSTPGGAKSGSARRPRATPPATPTLQTPLQRSPQRHRPRRAGTHQRS
jgi:hypothetical protein